MRLPLVFLAGLAVFWALETAQAAGTKVERLTSKNFKKEVIQSKDFFMVEFFAPWCGHCKALEPEWKKASVAGAEHARWGAVDCTVEKSLASKYGIRGFPTIIAFKDGKQLENVQVQRQADALVSYAKMKNPTGVQRQPPVPELAYDQMHDFLAKTPANVHVLYIPEAGKKAARLPKWLAKAAGSYNAPPEKDATRKAHFSSATSAAAKQVAGRFGLDAAADLPAVVFMCTNSNSFALHDGPMTWRAVLPALKEHIDAEATLMENNVSPTSADEAADVLPTGRRLLPAFPPKSMPKKRGKLRLATADANTLAAECFGVSSGVCMLLVGMSHDDAAAVAKNFRGEAATFLHVLDSDTTLSEWVTSSFDATAPAAVAVKSGKRARAAVGAAGDVATATSFVEQVLQGGVKFTRYPDGFPTPPVSVDAAAAGAAEPAAEEVDDVDVVDDTTDHSEL